MNISFEWKENRLIYRGDKPTTKSESMTISIEKWKQMIFHLQELISSGVNEDVFCGGIYTCGCCMLYHHQYCSGCPISYTTGQIYCKGSPHDDWEDLDRGDYEQMLEVAKRELAFLQQVKYDLNL